MLKAYDNCSVIQENGQMKVVTCGYVLNEYAQDHNFIGKYHAAKLYTEEERKQNFKETFGYEKRF